MVTSPFGCSESRVIKCEMKTGRNDDTAQDEEEDATIYSRRCRKLLLVVLEFFRPTMHAFRPRSQQAGA